MTRTLEQSLVRAENLRDWGHTNSEALEKSADFQDIIVLADEVERLRGMTRVASDLIGGTTFTYGVGSE